MVCTMASSSLSATSMPYVFSSVSAWIAYKQYPKVGALVDGISSLFSQVVTPAVQSISSWVGNCLKRRTVALPPLPDLRVIPRLTERERALAMYREAFMNFSDEGRQILRDICASPYFRERLQSRDEEGAIETTTAILEMARNRLSFLNFQRRLPEGFAERAFQQVPAAEWCRRGVFPLSEGIRQELHNASYLLQNPPLHADRQLLERWREAASSMANVWAQDAHLSCENFRHHKDTMPPAKERLLEKHMIFQHTCQVFSQDIGRKERYLKAKESLTREHLFLSQMTEWTREVMQEKLLLLDGASLTAEYVKAILKKAEELQVAPRVLLLARKGEIESSLQDLSQRLEELEWEMREGERLFRLEEREIAHELLSLSVEETVRRAKGVRAVNETVLEELWNTYQGAYNEREPLLRMLKTLYERLSSYPDMNALEAIELMAREYPRTLSLDTAYHQYSSSCAAINASSGISSENRERTKKGALQRFLSAVERMIHTEWEAIRMSSSVEGELAYLQNALSLISEHSLASNTPSQFLTWQIARSGPNDQEILQERLQHLETSYKDADGWRAPTSVFSSRREQPAEPVLRWMKQIVIHILQGNEMSREEFERISTELSRLDANQTVRRSLYIDAPFMQFQEMFNRMGGFYGIHRKKIVREEIQGLTQRALTSPLSVDGWNKDRGKLYALIDMARSCARFEGELRSFLESARRSPVAVRSFGLYLERFESLSRELSLLFSDVPAPFLTGERPSHADLTAFERTTGRANLREYIYQFYGRAVRFWREREESLLEMTLPALDPALQAEQGRLLAEDLPFQRSFQAIYARLIQEMGKVDVDLRSLISHTLAGADLFRFTDLYETSRNLHLGVDQRRTKALRKIRADHFHNAESIRNYFFRADRQTQSSASSRPQGTS